MEKYGYVPEDAKEKVGEDGKPAVVVRESCPKCGRNTEGNPPSCPVHGSLPFEKKR